MGIGAVKAGRRVDCIDRDKPQSRIVHNAMLYLINRAAGRDRNAGRRRAPAPGVLLAGAGARAVLHITFIVHDTGSKGTAQTRSLRAS